MTTTILGLYPELLAHGGVQRMAQHTALAQYRYARAENIHFEAWSFNDHVDARELVIAGETIPIRGFGRRQTTLLKSALALAPKCRFAYITHPNFAPIGLAMKFRSPNIRYAVHVHGIEVWKPLSLPRQIALSRAWLVTATSDYTRRRLLESQRLRPKHIEVLHPALDPDFDPRAAEQIAAPPEFGELIHKPFLLTVARLSVTETNKGIDTAIRAFGRISTQFPAAQYVIIGDGNDRQRLEKIAADAGVAGRVHFLGRQPDAVLRTFYHHCQIFVLPSAKEGFGIVFLEAMAHAKPAIGADAGGIPEVISANKTGFLIPFGDEATLANRMAELFSNDDLRDRMGRAALERVENDFLYSGFEKRLATIFNDGSV